MQPEIQPSSQKASVNAKTSYGDQAWQDRLGDSSKMSKTQNTNQMPVKKQSIGRRHQTEVPSDVVGTQ